MNLNPRIIANQNVTNGTHIRSCDSIGRTFIRKKHSESALDKEFWNKTMVPVLTSIFSGRKVPDFIKMAMPKLDHMEELRLLNTKG